MSRTGKRRSTVRRKIRVIRRKVDATKFWRYVLSRTARVVDTHDQVKALSLAEATHQVFK